MLRHLAHTLRQHRHEVVQVAGHTDERGSREYNLALGWRRAKAVSNYLLQQGVHTQQLDVMSYGKEKPISLAHNEHAWAENRRVSLVERHDHA